MFVSINTRGFRCFHYMNMFFTISISLPTTFEFISAAAGASGHIVVRLPLMSITSSVRPSFSFPRERLTPVHRGPLILVVSTDSLVALWGAEKSLTNRLDLN